MVVARRLSMACALVGVAATAAAQPPPIQNNDYSIDAVSTPILASGRILGLAGAFSPLAEGINGVPFNPASYAARTHWELDNFEWDLSAGISFPGAFSAGDLFLHGDDVPTDVDSSYFLDLGLRIQVADLGVGALMQFQTYQLTTGAGERVDAVLLSGHTGLGYSFLAGQLVAGLGLRLSNFDLTQNGTVLVQFQGAAPEAGAIFRFDRMPFRIGAAVRLPVNSVVVEDSMMAMNQQVQGFILPRSIHLPWEVQAGIAWQFGPRPFNQRFRRVKDVEDSIMEHLQERWCQREIEQITREHEAAGREVPALSCPLTQRAQEHSYRQREQARRQQERSEALRYADQWTDELEDHWEDLYESLPRRYVLVSADVLIQGPTTNGVGIDAFVEQEMRRRGANTSLAIRLGAETEPWHNRMKIRVGTYYEPARYENATFRIHGTLNAEIRLFKVPWLGDLKVGGTIDGARGYFNWGLSVGFWH